MIWKEPFDFNCSSYGFCIGFLFRSNKIDRFDERKERKKINDFHFEHWCGRPGLSCATQFIYSYFLDQFKWDYIEVVGNLLLNTWVGFNLFGFSGPAPGIRIRINGAKKDDDGNILRIWFGQKCTNYNFIVEKESDQNIQRKTERKTST